MIEGYGRVAIVTGAGQGLGYAIAKLFVEEGKRVVFVDISKKLLDAVKEEMKDVDPNHVMFIEMDVADVKAIRDCVDQVMKEWKRIDILVNNAGIRTETPIAEMTWEEWERVMAVNLGGTFFFSQAVMPIMKEQEWGRIINMSSYGGQFGPPTSSASYCASKSGQLVLTKIFARELAPYGVTVNTVAPAAIRTPEMDKIAPEKLEKMVKGIPVGRVGESDEVARMVSFLASESAGYVTGATFDINGGLLMR
jgi:NAD(P)-dependent dehydrogenase (short-subunit alcohol dehydrogenase family)